MLLFYFGLFGLNFLYWKDEIFAMDFCVHFYFLPNWSENGRKSNFLWPFFSHILRFLLNLIFSLGVIYFLFLNKKWTIQTGGLIILSFIFFFPIYLYCLYSHFEFGELFTFYIRRIIIQPIPLLVLIPMFYYLKKKQNHNSI